MSRYARPALFVILAAALVTSAGCTSGAPLSAALPAQTQSAQSSPPASTGRTSLGGTRQAADLTITLYSASKPPTRGTNVLEATVTDAQGQPVTDAQVAFDLDMTNMSHGKNVVAAAPQGDGRYAGRAFFMMPGPWRVITFVARPGQPTVQARFDFQVRLR